MLSLDVLPAGPGDALWITYGAPDALRHIVVDGGVNGTAAAIAARSRAAGGRAAELLVVTHIDDDHIGGILRALEDGALPYREVWFNGGGNLFSADRLSIQQGEELSRRLDRNRWNVAFGGRPAALDDAGSPRHVTLPGSLSVTLLGPGREQLDLLRSRWAAALRQASQPAPRRGTRDRLGGIEVDRLADEPSDPDGSFTNGSSIALLLEHDGGNCLLAGDAHADVLARSVTTLARSRGQQRLVVDVFKLPHHASAANVTRELIELVDAATYVVSTDAARHGHPDQSAIARVLKYGPRNRKRLCFNYDTPETRLWDNAALKRRWRYETQFGVAGAGVLVDVR